jgi:hypothetical protein
MLAPDGSGASSRGSESPGTICSIKAAVKGPGHQPKSRPPTTASATARAVTRSWTRPERVQVAWMTSMRSERASESRSSATRLTAYAWPSVELMWRVKVSLYQVAATFLRVRGSVVVEAQE